MQDTLSMQQLSDARGTPVYDSQGEKIGDVEEIFYDEETNRPEWVGIGTGFFGTKRVLVPVTGAELGNDRFVVPYDKAQVKDSPDIDSDELSQATEQDLYAYYGLEYSERRSDTGLPEADRYLGERDALDTGVGEGAVDSAGDAAEGPAALTRSEEELRVGKREVEAGRARLRKWVETEPVQTDVELRQETARVTREPIEQTVSGAEIGDEEVEMSLRAEEAVVEKQTVAKERIGLETDVETERATVDEQVRKERVEVEGDLDERR